MNNQYGIAQIERDRNGYNVRFHVYRINPDGSLSQVSWQSRELVISQIELNIPFYTLPPDRFWSGIPKRRGERIHVVDTEYGKYLRTNRNPERGDNLSELPVVEVI